MNHNKKIIIALGIIFSVILLSISMLKISINILYPVNELSNSLKESFKDIFGKAIKFDTLHFKYNGDIVLQNFYLSNRSDFNDNINLIKCDEITIDTYLFDLIRKKVTFAGVYMVEPEITFIKNYGKPYYELFIDDIAGAIDRDKVKQFIKNGFRFELTDSKLSFRETFKNSKSEINLYDLDFKIKYKNDYINYRSYGKIEDKARDSWFKSNYRAIGKIYLNKPYSESEIELENFDLTHLNNMLNDEFTYKTSLNGNLSGQLKVITDNGLMKCQGNVDTSSLNLFYYSTNKPYPLFKNKDIESKFDFTLTENMDKLTVNKLEIDDGTVKLNSSLDFVVNDYFSITMKSNKIDLKSLSESLILFKNCSYTGYLSFDGICNYKLKDNKPENLDFNLTLNNFNIIPDDKENSSLTNIKTGDLTIKADKDKILIKSNFKSGKSDFKILYDSLISNWNPIKSSNKIEIFSDTIELNLLNTAALNIIKGVYSLAYVDMFQNFDEQRNFLKEPEGIFVNNNDVSLKIHADKVGIAGKSSLNNFNLDLSLLKGTVKTNNFTLEGYNGIYSFNLYSSLNSEYPYFKFEAEAKNIDLNIISYESALTYSLGGILSLGANFETSAFRIGQIIENGKAGFNMTITDGYFNNTTIQNKLHYLLSRNNYTNIFNKRIDFTTYSMSFFQSGNNFYIKNFNLNSENLSFNAYGNYTEEEGLKIPMNLNASNEKGTERVPLEITGNLEAPCVKVKSKNESESVCF